MAEKKITKKSPKTVRSSAQNVLPENMIVPEKEAECCSSSCCLKGKILKKHLLVLAVLVILIAVLGYFFKDKIIIAIVNGKPIFRYELSQRLTSTFGKETLENIIVEKLIREEAGKKGIVIGDSDVEKEVEKIGKSLGNGMKIEDVLKMQGVSLADFKNQLKLRLQVNKILEKEITVSDEEIDKFIKDNSRALIATGEAEKKTEAREKLKEQKISEQIQKWIGDLLAKSKITRFLK